MRIRRRIAATTAAVAIMTAGLTAVTTSQAAAVGSCSKKNVTGSGGHAGAYIACKGSGRFQAYITCERTDNGLDYTHYAAWRTAPGTAAVWCDLGARVTGWGKIVG
ncbi:hypothetical protein ABZZ17_37475 [Streptomyces sp. NPDC006512]|uniref:hypothetical protein n=1 Tax=Streptomyces sp. NPDC006512 TaxID=3154307 RepID=UPI0033A79A55